MRAYLHGRSFRPDASIDSLWTLQVPAKRAELWWQARGLSYTASGYDRRIPSPYMVFFNGRWRRVYVCQFSNAGTAYIGQWVTGRGSEITVADIEGE